MTDRQDHGLARAPATLAACALLLVLGAAISLWASWTGYIRAPFSDGHDWIAEVFRTETSHDWIAYLWRPHSHQRIPVARLVQALDIEVGRGRVPSFLIAAWIALLLGLASLLAAIRRSGLPTLTAAWLGCLAGLLLVNVAACEDLAIPGFSVYLFVAGPALAAMVAFEWSAGAGWRSPGFILALMFAVMAGCGDAAGLAVWPVLILSALRQHRPLAQILTLAAITVVVTALFQLGLGAPAKSLGGAGFLAPAHLWKMLQYFAGYGGLPWSRTIRSGVVATLFGLGVEIAAATALVRTGRPGGGPVERIGAAMIAFGLLTAAMAAVGRVDELPDPIAPMRYVPFAMMLQAGLALCCAQPAKRLIRRWPRQANALLAAVAILLVAFQAYGARRFVRTSRQIEAASTAFDRGDRSPATLAMVFPDPERAAAVRAELKARGFRY